MYKENRPEAPASTGEKIDKFLHGAAVFMFGKDSLIRYRAFVLAAAATACATGFLALSSPHELNDTATKLLLADDDSKGVVPQFGTIVFARGDDGSLKAYDVREPNLPEDVELFEVSRYGGMSAFSPAYVQGDTPSMDRLRIVVNGMVVLENPHLYHDVASSEMTATP